MHVTGYLRFSFLGRSDTKNYGSMSGDLDLVANALFSKERMESRFSLFEQICLPSLRAQTDPEFDLIILASHSMPTEFKDRLLSVTRDVKQIKVVFEDVKTVKQALKPLTRKIVSNTDQNTVHFRFDDDDALSCHYIERLKRAAVNLEPGTLLSFARGIQVHTEQDETLVFPVVLPFIAIGWARVNAPGDIRTPYHFNHQGAGNNNPHVVDRESLAFVHTIHGASDSIERKRARLDRKRMLANAFDTSDERPRINEEFEREFKFGSLDDLKKMFQAL